MAYPQTAPMSNYGWSTQTDVENIVGVTNVATWSNPSGFNQNGPVVANPAVVQSAFNRSDGDIYSCFFSYGNYTVPLSPNNGAVYVVNKWSAKLTAVELYLARGLRDGGEDNKYSKMRDEVISEMIFFRSGSEQLDATKRWPQATAPTAG